MMGWYILDGHTPVQCDDTEVWGKWMHAGDRRVDQDFRAVPPVRISTVFLGLDHNHFGAGPPVLFETMIFGGPLDGYQERCCTWDEAVQMHAVALALVEETK